MKGNFMKTVESENEVRHRPRPVKTVPLTLPSDVIASLQKVAERRGMGSYEALMKFYIGQGLRDDLARLFYDRVLVQAAEVLARHNHSEEEIAAILAELRMATE